MMGKSTVAKSIEEPVVTTIELNSDSNTWCTDWDDISKRFYVYVSDQNNKPMSGITINLSKDSDVLTLDPVNTPPTNDDGLATLLYTVKGPVDSYKITARQVMPPSSLNNTLDDAYAELTIELVTPTLAAPRVPAALDGVIDDDDYESSVVASIISPNMKQGDQVFLLWGDNEIARNVTDDLQYYIFSLTGPGVTPNELLFQNQTYFVRAFVSDPLGNGEFSTARRVKVNRTRGGGGLKYCEPLDIPMGDDGFINRAEVRYGVSIIIPDSSISGGELPEINSQLSDSNTTAVSINLVSRSKQGQLIDTLNIPVEIPVNVVDGQYTYHEDKTLESKPLKDFLMNIGEGSFSATYNVTNSGITYSAKRERVYEVDVIPPGGF
ncbi:TPA: hypothetical protein ACXE9F_000386 [Pluralibacter gergoviae]